MADGRRRDEWDRAAVVAACAANANPFRSEPLSPDQIGPYAKPKSAERRPIRETRRELSELFKR